MDTDFYVITASELMIPPGAQSQVLDGDDEGGGKRRKNAEAAVDTHYIIRKLDEFLSEKLHPSSSSEEDAGSDSVDAAAEAQRKRERNTRSIESLRKTYNKEFLSTNAKGACPHCGSVTKTIVFFK